MVVVTVELWPGGDPTFKKLLGRATIANDGTGQTARGNYQAMFYGKRGAVGSSVVKGFPRKRLGAWDLILRALRPCFEARNPKITIPSETLSGVLADLRHAYKQLHEAGNKPVRVFGHDYVSVGQGSCGKCGGSREEHSQAGYYQGSSDLKLFAEGLIAPAIRKLEGLTQGTRRAKVSKS